MTPGRRVLLTSLSPTPQETRYSLNGETVVARQSPLALLQLLPPEDMHDDIIVLCTDEIRKEQFASVKKEMLAVFERKGIQPGSRHIMELNIPDGKTREELWEILRAILNLHIPRGVHLTLDITHGFRSFPFVFFTAAVFLKALRDVDIKAVYYGMITKDRDTTVRAPMVDLSLILDMVEWFYATRIFKETGQAHHLNRLLVKLEAPPEGIADGARAPYNHIKPLREALDDVTSSYAQALPIELGLVSAQALYELSKADFTEVMRKQIPVPDELMNILKDFIEPFALPLPLRRDKKNKNNIPLDVDELERQAQLIDSYLEQGYLNYAVGMMREWMVSAALMHNATINTDAERKISWLGYKRDRKPVEGWLNDLAKTMESTNSESKVLLTDEQEWLGSKWLVLREKRNQLAHHGYRYEYSLQSAKHIEEVLKLWKELRESLHNQSGWQLGLMKRPTQGSLLISPLGLSKGLLFSALRHTRPSRALVITSRQSSAGIQEIIDEAGWEGEPVVLSMEEPFTGFDEAEKIVRKIQPMLQASEEVVVNITGGTTAMQYVVQEVAESAARQRLPLKMAALIDRRPPEEQKANPYVLGEIVWLKNKKNDED